MSDRSTSVGGRFLAVVAYLTSVVGAVLVLLLNKRDDLARYHAYQSLGIAVIGIALFAAWALVSIVIALIPYYGMILLSVSAALVLGFGFFLCGSVLSGIIFALQYKQKRVLFVGGMIESTLLRIKRQR